MKVWHMLDESVEHSYNTVPVQVWVTVDRGIAPLVIALNQVPNMRTYASCQGRKRSVYDNRAYVMIGSTREDEEAALSELDAYLSPYSYSGYELDFTRKTLYVDREHVEALALLVNRFSRSLSEF